MAPTDVTPVLVSAAHFAADSSVAAASSDDGRLLVPMMWGLIPSWHTGNYLKHGLTTNNCRLENLAQSKLYQPSFRAGQRCVILCEGFYEWQTTNAAQKASERPAYYIYMPQTGGVKRQAGEGEDATRKHTELLKMAGLFDVWTDENGDSIYSYTVITFESTDNFKWLHHRSPAVLETEQQVAVSIVFFLMNDLFSKVTLFRIGWISSV